MKKQKKEAQKPHYFNHRKRLRKRFLEQGIEGLQTYEILELFLTFVVPLKDTKPAAKEAIDKFKTIKGFFDAHENELKEVTNFKENAITLRQFIKEVALLYQKQQAEHTPLSFSKDELIKYCKNKLGFNKNEEFWMFSLDSKKAIIEENLISKGLSDKAPVYPRTILEFAVKDGASSILLLHNHPNGNPQASEQDITITKAIDIPARVLNIKIFDHIIVAGDDYYSFKENKNL